MSELVRSNVEVYRVWDESMDKVDYVDHEDLDTALYVQQVQEYEFGWLSWIEVFHEEW